MVILPASPGQSFWKIEKFCNEGGNLPGIMNRQGKSCEYCYMPCNAELRIVEYHFPDVKYILDTMDCIDKTIFLSFEKARSKLKEPNSK